MTPVLYSSPEQCCACRACSNVCPKNAITFTEDRYGFLFPHIDESLCVECGQCVKACNFHPEAPDFKKEPIKGYAAVLNDKATVKNSTSGGAFMAMAAWILKKGGCVYGCVWDKDMNAVHVCAETMQEVLPMQGSKYVQSDVGKVYSEIKAKLRDGRFVLFAGTPCQVAALRSVLGGKEYDNLFTLDLICHGVPNNRFFHQYLSYLAGKYRGKITDFHFRHKNPDWLHGCVWMEIDKGSRKIIKKLMYAESPYSWLFSKKNKCSRLSCSSCKYACSGRVGDMTIGDFWGHKKVKIGFDYKEGLSCILVNNPKVLPVLDERDLTIQEVSIESIINGNTHLRQPSEKDLASDYVMEKSATDGFGAIASEYFKDNSRLILKKKVQAFIKKIKALIHG